MSRIGGTRADRLVGGSRRWTARVSSERDAKSKTIEAANRLAPIAGGEHGGRPAPSEFVFEDDGFSRANLQRPCARAIRGTGAFGRVIYKGAVNAIYWHPPRGAIQRGRE